MSKENEAPKQERPKYELLAIAAKGAFLTVCDEKKWNTEIVFAMQIIRSSTGNNSLQQCAEVNPQSITNAVANVALTGTTLNPALQMAFLVPRTVNGKLTCCLDHSYRGLANIATGSGGVLDMDADCVYQGDFFSYERGTEPFLKHVPFSQRVTVADLKEIYGELELPVPQEELRVALTQRQKGVGKGEFTHVYATAKLPDGKGGVYTKFIVLEKEEVDAIRKTSKAPNSPMWTNHYGEGARKTAIKKLYKLLPQTDRMSIAIAQLNEFEGIDFDNQKKQTRTGMERFNDEAKTETVVEAEVIPEPCPLCKEVGGHASLCPDNVPTDGDLFGKES